MMCMKCYSEINKIRSYYGVWCYGVYRARQSNSNRECYENVKHDVIVYRLIALVYFLNLAVP